jgi:hypothetical protein
MALDRQMPGHWKAHDTKTQKRQFCHDAPQKIADRAPMH